jgi:hypothetical protein
MVFEILDLDIYTYIYIYIYIERERERERERVDGIRAHETIDLEPGGAGSWHGQNLPGLPRMIYIYIYKYIYIYTGTCLVYSLSAIVVSGGG